jgi:hypothetical protein
MTGGDCKQRVIKYEMENALPNLLVPMLVKLSVGPSWGALQPYQLPQ